MLSSLLALFCSSTFGLTDVAETEEHEGGSWTGVTVEHSQDMRGRTNGVGIAGAGTHSFSLGYDGYGRPASSTSSGFAGGGVTSVELLVRGTLAGAGHNGTDAVADKQVWVAVPAASKSFSYDGAGRLTGDSNWVYDWDARGHLMGMTRKAGTSADPQVTAETLNFTYDADGRRVRKVHTVSFQNAPDQVSDSKMLWDGWLPVMEQRTVNGVAKPKRWFVWGRDVSGDWDGAGGVGGLAAIIEEGGRALLPVDDGLGNIMALVSAGSGNVVAKYDHGPYGEVWGSEGETDASPFRYQGKLYDAETGLYYFGYRYYSPKMGRWLSRDPLGEAGGFNLYAYCLNDPVNNYDYLGGEPRIVVAHDEAGQIILSESVRIANGVPQVQYSDWANWWGPLIGGARNSWWQSPSADEMARLFRRDGGGWRLATGSERHQTWEDQFVASLPGVQQRMQDSMTAFAQANALAVVTVPTAVVSGPTLLGGAQVAAGRGWMWWASGNAAMWGTRAGIAGGGTVAGYEMMNGVPADTALANGGAAFFNVVSMTGMGNPRFSVPQIFRQPLWQTFGYTNSRAFQMGSVNIGGIQGQLTLYPRVIDPRTSRTIPFPSTIGNVVPPAQRVPWGSVERGQFIAEWYRRGYATPRGGWENYDIHHIKPREFGGGNEFWNLVPVERRTHQGLFNSFWRNFLGL